MLIFSEDGSHKAIIIPVADGDGCWVTLTRVAVPEPKPIGTWFLRGPLHVVLDKMHDVVWPMSKETDTHTLVWDADLRRVVRRRNTSHRRRRL